MKIGKRSTVMITGSTGFAGASVIEKFVKEGHKVIAVLRIPDVQDLKLKNSILEQNVNRLRGIGNHSENIRIFTANINDGSKIKSILLENNVDCIIHLAGQSSVVEAEKNKKATYRVNANLTEKLAKISVDVGNKMNKHIEFIYISSIRVVRCLETLDLKRIVDVNAVYDASKILAEKKLRSIANLNATIIYSPGLFGSGEAHTLVATWVKNGLNRKNIIILGDPSTKIPLCSLGAFVEQLHITMLDNIGKSGIKKDLVVIEYNYSLYQIANTICDCLDRIAVDNVGGGNVKYKKVINSHRELVSYERSREF
ncbi:NAD-dependent epimerase/dehydratase family protein [Marinimicrobium locisalis]|uniref:NAD-dependent epimerase/dehydratase family protein n=1 Tax=Marinimicrobium locisalis TaxID=546022 RepID=UPI0032215055